MQAPSRLGSRLGRARCALLARFELPNWKEVGVHLVTRWMVIVATCNCSYAGIVVSAESRPSQTLFIHVAGHPGSVQLRT